MSYVLLSLFLSLSLPFSLSLSLSLLQASSLKWAIHFSTPIKWPKKEPGAIGVVMSGGIWSLHGMACWCCGAHTFTLIKLDIISSYQSL